MQTATQLNRPPRELSQQRKYSSLIRFFNNNKVLYLCYAIILFMLVATIVTEQGALATWCISIIAAVVVISTIVGRNKMNRHAMRTYKHRAGKHDAKPAILQFHSGANALEALVKFDYSCEYKPMEDDWNKLVGLSYKLLPWYDPSARKWRPGHHKYSDRFAWRPVAVGMIEIGAYVYENGKRKVRSIGVVGTGSWYYLKLERDNFNAYYSILSKFYQPLAMLPIVSAVYPDSGYVLSTWFGGNNPCHKDMQLELAYVAEKRQMRP